MTFFHLFLLLCVIMAAAGFICFHIWGKERPPFTYLLIHLFLFCEALICSFILAKYFGNGAVTGRPVTLIAYFCSVYSCALFLCVFLQCVQFGTAADVIMSLHVAIELSIHIKTCRSLAQNDLVIMLTLQPDTL